MSPRKSSGPGRRRSLRRALHRSLIVAETLLFLGVFKDWIWHRILAFDLPNWGKVTLAMITTVGLFGGLIVVLRKITSRGVETAHQAARGLPLAFPALLMHVALLCVLFLLYARMLELALP